MDRLLTARDISERVDVLPATVLRWTRNGDLPAIRLPSGQIRYPEQAFEDWLAARATPQEPQEFRDNQGPYDAALAAAPRPHSVSSTVRDNRRHKAVSVEKSQEED